MHTITRDDRELAGATSTNLRREWESLAVPLPPDQRPGLLGDMLAVHYDDVADNLWSVEVIDDQLRIRGELDFSTTDRFTAYCAPR